MNILAIDTSAETLSVGLSTDAGAFCVEADAGCSQSELLFDAVDAVTSLAKVDREAIDLFACMKGPGSFTGLRIGFAAVKGMALALGKKMLSVPTLDCMAYFFGRSPLLCVPVLDARQGRFFTALYRGGRRLTGYLDCTAGELAGHIAANVGDAPPSGTAPADRAAALTGRAAAPAREALSPLLPDVTLLAAASCGGASALLQYVKELDTVISMEGASAPLYIRKSDAEIRRNGNRA